MSTASRVASKASVMSGVSTTSAAALAGADDELRENARANLESAPQHFAAPGSDFFEWSRGSKGVSDIEEGDVSDGEQQMTEEEGLQFATATASKGRLGAPRHFG